MYFLTDLSIVALVYLIIIAGFYFFRKQIASKRNRVFSYLLISVIVLTITEVLCSILDNNIGCPTWILQLLHLLLFASFTICGPLLLLYVLTFYKLFNKIKKFLWIVYIPYLLLLLFIIITVNTESGIFYINDENIYKHGLMFNLLYLYAAIYFVLVITLITFSRKKIKLKKIAGLVISLVVILLSIIVQSIHPENFYLGLGSTLYITIIYHNIQLPEEHIDYLTRLLDGESLPLILQELQERDEKYRMIFFTIDSFYQINQSYGYSIGDELTLLFSDYLRKIYPKNFIFRFGEDTFVILDTSLKKDLVVDDLKTLKNNLPPKWFTHLATVSLNIFVYGMNSSSFKNKSLIANTIDYIIFDHDNIKNKDLTIVDALEYIEYEQIEQALNRAVDENTIDVYYQPIHDEKENLVALEALCRIIDPVIGYVNPEIFIRIAERNGKIHQLGDLVLEKVCKFIKENEIDKWNLHHIGVNLSFLQCSRNDFCEKIASVINKYEINKETIKFEITETQSSSKLPIVNANMRKLIDMGFSFLLDDFGNGYANYSYLFELPFFCIKIDKSILWQAMKNKRDNVYLKALVGSLAKIGFTIVCEGVETKEQRDLLASYGVNMFQGYYFSKALNEKEIIEYYKVRK